jgi:hypothetical protein
MKKRRYGKDVYGSNGIQILVFGYVLIVMLQKIHQGSMAIDTISIATITALLGNIMNAYNSIRIQWQTNNAHQRVNAMKGNANHLPAVLP